MSEDLEHVLVAELLVQLEPKVSELDVDVAVELPLLNLVEDLLVITNGFFRLLPAVALTAPAGS